jgi:hypothetical protein
MEIMKAPAQVGWMAAMLLGLSAAAMCQSTLPPMAPTMRDVEEHPATVEYTDGRIAVTADNSSLKDILREIARRAGMAVEGSVIEERVFGQYGPGAPAEVLSALLVGTGTNIMVASGKSHAPQLILSPQHGGPTPPDPGAQRRRAEAEARERERERLAIAEETARTDTEQAEPPATGESAAAAKVSDGSSGVEMERQKADSVSIPAQKSGPGAGESGAVEATQ